MNNRSLTRRALFQGATAGSVAALLAGSTAPLGFAQEDDGAVGELTITQVETFPVEHKIAKAIAS